MQEKEKQKQKEKDTDTEKEEKVSEHLFKCYVEDQQDYAKAQKAQEENKVRGEGPKEKEREE